MRYAIALVICLVSGCSLTWHNRDYPVQSQVGQCPTQHWPYIVDLSMATLAASAGAVMHAELVKPGDLGVENNTPGFHFSIPIFMMATAFGISAWGGIGEVISCQQQE